MPKTAFPALAICVFYIVFAFRKGAPASLRKILPLTFVTAPLLHWVNTLPFMKWAVLGWHFSFYIFGAFVGLVYLFDTYLYKVKIKIPLILFAMLLVFGLAFWGVIKTQQRLTGMNFALASHKAAQWTDANLPSQTILGMTDTGVFSFFSNRRVVNLDGVTNNFQYQEALRDGMLSSYLDANGVSFIAQHGFRDNPSLFDSTYTRLVLRIPSRLYPPTMDSVILYPQDEVYRSAPYYDGPILTRFIIWKR